MKRTSCCIPAYQLLDDRADVSRNDCLCHAGSFYRDHRNHRYSSQAGSTEQVVDDLSKRLRSVLDDLESELLRPRLRQETVWSPSRLGDCDHVLVRFCVMDPWKYFSSSEEERFSFSTMLDWTCRRGNAMHMDDELPVEMKEYR